MASFFTGVSTVKRHYGSSLSVLQTTVVLKACTPRSFRVRTFDCSLCTSIKPWKTRILSRDSSKTVAE